MNETELVQAVGRLDAHVGDLQGRMERFEEVCSACRGSVNGSVAGVHGRINRLEERLVAFQLKVTEQLAANKATIRVWTMIGAGVGSIVGAVLAGLVIAFASKGGAP